MAFVLPTFNLSCDVRDWAFGETIGAVRFTVDCQLRAPDMKFAALNAPTPAIVTGIVALFPPGTDIRDKNCAPGNSEDTLEIPAGSGRYYTVMYVDDVAKGFANEHRYAILRKRTLTWPVPIP